MIYFVTDGTYTKIGYTNENVCSVNFKRMGQLQTGNPNKLSVVCLILHQGISLEKKIHKRLEQYRVNGEWFDLREFDLDAAFEKMRTSGYLVCTAHDMKVAEEEEFQAVVRAFILDAKKAAEKKKEDEERAERKRKTEIYEAIMNKRRDNGWDEPKKEYRTEPYDVATQEIFNCITRGIVKKGDIAKETNFNISYINSIWLDENIQMALKIFKEKQND